MCTVVQPFFSSQRIAEPLLKIFVLCVGDTLCAIETSDSGDDVVAGVFVGDSGGVDDVEVVIVMVMVVVEVVVLVVLVALVVVVVVVVVVFW